MRVESCPDCAESIPAGAATCSYCGWSRLSALQHDAPSVDEGAFGKRWREQFEEGRIAAAPESIQRNRQRLAAVNREMRAATALFADIVGFSAMSREYHPEEMEGLVREFTRIAIEEAEARNGTIVDFAGDGVFMVFGAPYSYGNDAASAVAVAFRLMARLGEARSPDGQPLRARAGVATGEILSTSKETGGATRQFAVIGPPVNLAARLEQNCPPGQVLLCATTARLVSRRWELKKTGPLPLKNIAEGYVAHQAIGERREEMEAPASSTPFVGRGKELDLLEAWLSRPTSETPSTCVVSGEAGIGKTRLVAQAIYRRAERLNPLFFECAPDGEHALLSCFLRHFRSQFGGVAAGEESVAAWFAERPHLRPDGAAILGYLLGDKPSIIRLADTPPADVRGAAERFLAEYLRSPPAGFDGNVVVFDNLQWIDSLSRSVLAKVIEGSGGAARVLLLRRDEERGLLDLEAKADLRIEVEPLGQSDAEELLLRMGEDLGIGENRLRRLAARGGGNPLYQLEMVDALRDLASAKGSELSDDELGSILPDSLRELIQWRIDRLEGRARQVLQVGAVIGYEFARGLLSAVDSARANLQESLTTLLDRDFLRERRPPAGELLLRFLQALARDVAYTMLLPGERRALHREIATRLEEVGHESRGEAYEALARHWENAGEPSTAARWHAKVSEHREEMGAYREAGESCRRALSLCEKSSALVPAPLRIRLRIRLGYVLDGLGRYAEADGELSSALAEADQIGNALLAQEAKTWRALALLRLGKRSEAESALEEVIPELEAAANDRLLLPALLNLGELRRDQGRNAEAKDVFRRVAREARRANAPSSLADALNNEALVLWGEGDAETAGAMLSEAIDLYRAGQRLPSLTGALVNAGLIRQTTDEILEARRAFEEAGELAERLGQPLHGAIVWLNLSNLELQAGRFAEARSRGATALAAAERLESRQVAAYALNNMARAEIGLSNAAEAIRLARRSVQTFRSLDRDGGDVLVARLTAAEARLLPPNIAFPTRLRRALVVAKAIGERAREDGGTLELQLRSGLVRARFLFCLGDSSAAVELAREVVSRADKAANRQYASLGRRLLETLAPENGSEAFD
jgi:class 3 adenylate cyclase/tetratricopeptide (TPR) repeat protein